MSCEVVMLGTGSPRMNKERFATAQLLKLNDTLVLVDVAEGATMQLVRSGVNPKFVKHLFITHLHADHITGYANFLISGWVEGRRELTVVGPKGTKRMHELTLEMLREDLDYRMQLGRPMNGIYDVNIIEVDTDGEVAVNIAEGITVGAMKMVHNVVTYAYRFNVGEESIVCSGDTAPHDGIIEISKGADALILDTCLTLNPNDTAENAQEIWNNLQREHCTPEQSAEIAKAADVSILIMTHFLPGMDPVDVRKRAEAIFDGQLVIPNDLDTIQVKKQTVIL